MKIKRRDTESHQMEAVSILLSSSSSYSIQFPHLYLLSFSRWFRVTFVFSPRFFLWLFKHLYSPISPPYKPTTHVNKNNTTFSFSTSTTASLLSFIMRLYVSVLEARDLSLKNSNSVEQENEIYALVNVKLHLGKYRARTLVVKNNPNPVWNEEFVFRVTDLEDELVVSVYKQDTDHHHHHGLFGTGGTGDFLGRVRVPVSAVFQEENRTLPPTWFSLQKPKISATEKSMSKDVGKILLTLTMHGGANHFPTHSHECAIPAEKCHDAFCSATLSRKIPEGKHFMKAIVGRFEKLFHKNDEVSKSESTNDDSSDLSCTASDYEDCLDEPSKSDSFEEAIESRQSRDDELEMPEDLYGGILVNQTYEVSPKDLNMLLFMPNSQFKRNLAELQGTKNLQEGPWTWKSGETSCLTRVVTYIKAASKLVKAVKATEEQTYIKANGKEFVVMITVSTPDVPYGNCFKIDLLYKIVPGPELASGEESSHLIISWKINFHQSTMMKGMIEGGARQGLKESFEKFADLLAQNIKVFDSDELSDKDQMLASLHLEHQSDWQLAVEYFGNFTTFTTIFMILYVLVHILLSEFTALLGLEFNGLDLPDSFGELITCAVLVLQGEQVFYMISHYIQARLKRGSHLGVKPQDDGWVLTVALIEGSDIASMDATGFSDPYVVFTCNGKTRTSSVKLQTRDPQWKEILVFDALEEPPSVLEVEVFDFDGPFDHAVSLGHAEINFLRHTSTELADMWIVLEGKLAQASQSKLHLRIFLDNNGGLETIKEYLTKMEKEVGKKLNLRSPHKNSMFQKLFGLPVEEFLINDFSCSLKRKMPLQGRLFLSARIVGFYSNLFGHKTKFFFLWEDIEDIEVIPPSLASVGSPSLAVVLRKGRGLDASHSAKSQDEEGRLRFHFQSFVSFKIASRTIMALWKTRSATPEPKAEAEEEQQDQDGYIQIEDSGPFLEIEDANMLKVYSAELPVNIKSVMEMFDGGNLEHRVMEKSGCLDYETTPWEAERNGVYERHLCYKFNCHVSMFGGEVSSIQQKRQIASGTGWTVDEVMTLHDVPFGDHFRVRLRYHIETPTLSSTTCHCNVYLGTVWLKLINFQQRITRNITDKFTLRLKEIFELVEREILLESPQGDFR